MKNKRWLQWALIVVVITSLAFFFATGCQEEKKAEGAAEAEEKAEEEVPAAATPAEGMYFRLVTHGGDDPFWAVVQQGMRDAATELGCRADIALSGGDLSKQKQAFQEAVAANPDGIALVINDATAWDEPVKNAIDNGIPVIGINNDDPEGAQGNARLCYIGQNETRAATKLARKVFQTGEDEGVDMGNASVAMAAEVPGAAYAQIRGQGIRDAAAEFGIPEGNIEVIDAGGLEMSVVESRITSYLTANPNTNFIYGLGGICTDRLTSSLKAAGKEAGEVYAGGFDAAPGTLEGIKEGYVITSIDQQQYLQGYFAVYTLYLYNKYKLTPTIDTGGYLITEENVDFLEDLSGKYR
jgi:simple sugar transport system substrate-binding protein